MKCDKILNSFQNYIPYYYNEMEEYQFWEQTIRSDEVQRWLKHYFDEEGKMIYNGYYKPKPFEFHALEGKDKLQFALQVFYAIDYPTDLRARSFSSLKARFTRGDYKISNWWGKFKKELYEYNGAKAIQGYMLNISPKWPEKYQAKKYARFLEDAIKKFAHSGKWKEFHYVIETGKKGDHLHAHCVCIPTDPLVESVKTYMKKGNHAQWFRREFDNKNNSYPEGFVGCCRAKHSIQIVQINNYEIYKDKLAYLQEETKPEDHKNKSKYMNPIEIEF